MGYLFILITSWFNTLYIKGKGYLVAILAFAWMAYLGGAASAFTTLDYANYATYYQLTAAGVDVRLEWLYTLLSRRAVIVGLDYAQFRLILFGVTFAILFVAVIRLTELPVLFAACFMLFPFFDEVTQVRSFVAYSIALLATSFLSRLSLKRILVFEALIVLAIGFHSSAGVFVLLPLLQYAVQKTSPAHAARVVDIVMIVFALFLLVFSKINFLVNLIAKLLLFVSSESTSNSFLSLMAQQTGSKKFFLEVFIGYWLFKKLILWAGKDNPKAISANVYSLFLLGQLLLPLLLISDQMQRLPRLGIEAAILIIGTLVATEVSKSKRAQQVILLTLGLVLVNAFFYYGLLEPSAPFPTSIPYLAHFYES